DTLVFGAVAGIRRSEDHLGKVKAELILTLRQRDTVGEASKPKAAEWRLVGRPSDDGARRRPLLGSESHLVLLASDEIPVAEPLDAEPVDGAFDRRAGKDTDRLRRFPGSRRGERYSGGRQLR